jgi:ketosteroid isomerase-like protein
MIFYNLLTGFYKRDRRRSVAWRSCSPSGARVKGEGKEAGMRQTSVQSLICITLVIFCGSCTQIRVEEQRETQIEEIAKTIDSCIGWFKDKDFELLFSVVAHDPDYISVHPTDKVIRGFGQFAESSEVFKNPDFKYVRHELKDLTINLSMSGDVAWFYCVLDDINEWKGNPANWENARWTGVLERRNGRWVIVQQHFSFASA